MKKCKEKNGRGEFMDWEKELYRENENPLDTLVDGYSNTSVFRTMAFIGDSLSSGEFETLDKEGTRKYHDLYEYSWGQYIARKNGLKAYNFSCGGLTAQGYINWFADKEDLWNPEKACQAYVMALGVNDIFGKGKMEVGSLEDLKTGKETFLYFYAKIVEKYKEISPDAKFFFVTFPNTGKPEKEEKSLAMIKALEALAEYVGNAYVINLYKYGPVYDEKFEEKFFLHYHMNPMGYILTARLIDSYIDYIVRHNPDDFRNIGFVGTDIKYKF